MNACQYCGIEKGEVHRAFCPYLPPGTPGSLPMQDEIKAAELAIIRLVTNVADRWPVDIEAVDLESVSAPGTPRLAYVCRLRVIVRPKESPPFPWPGPTTPGHE